MGSRTRQKKEAPALPAVQIAQFTSRLAKKLISTPAGSEPCRCVVFEQASTRDTVEQEVEWDDGQRVPVSQELYMRIRELVTEFLSEQKPVSILLLHLVQRESTPLAPQSPQLYQRRRYHASSQVRDQVLTNVRRVLRLDDKMFIFDTSGAAIIFAGVDQVGIQKIAERIFSSVCLLQAETMIPPLTRETRIVLGVATYPYPAATFEELTQHYGKAIHTLVLRPVITTQLRGVKPIPMVGSSASETEERQESHVPRLELPGALPERLKQLIPGSIAIELKCVPVGCEHHCLTVAMQEPTNAASIARLRALTGHTIFPVACEESELNTLLASY
ncbi:hypothetical protein KDW_24230 [Dictyobacter vulcani]|uniref:Type II secretion system protein GspE N-terminal domain-containing protein n=1 Tax=Dictyobacter vulcani TaxID=2607529 RepID=A0A5J4KPG9_9CHLR|nr:hypothetical protein [Dictyobacter vulcani]GER88261.1 hypothetical protein KDW_24230 [Dictyobacter vulcani]